LKIEPLTESYYYILLCLYEKPSHGYGIMQRVLELSDESVKIGSGTMYGATNNMLKRGWIKETPSISMDDRKKRLYEITESGKFILESEITRINKLIKSYETITKGGSYE